MRSAKERPSNQTASVTKTEVLEYMGHMLNSLGRMARQYDEPHLAALIQLVKLEVKLRNSPEE
jgi:hypothetical protein